MTRIVQLVLEFLKRLFGRTESLPAPTFPPPPQPIPPELAEQVEDPETPPTYVPSVEPPVDEDFKMSRPTLSRGATDKKSVRELQALLNTQGEKLTVDGDFGGGTERAIKAYQVSYGLTETGIADRAIWELLERPTYGKDIAYSGVPLPPSTSATGSSGVAKAWNAYGNLLTMLGGSIGITPSVACAVLATESAGEGFWNGRMVIRFENHIYKSRAVIDSVTFNDHFQMDADKKWLGHKWRQDAGAWRALHTKTSGQDEEWAVLGYARSLDNTGALMSISMGAPQIMGFNYAKVGFPTVQEMFDAFSTDERSHVLGLFDFIRSDHKMVRALRTGDWKGFAYIYNGSGQADHYGGVIGGKVSEAKELGIA
jgi:hypothetical protein